MDNTIDVTIPVDAEAARALESPERREAAGRYLSDLLRDGGIRVILAKAIADAKQEAHANGLTDNVIDLELDTWRSERQA